MSLSCDPVQETLSVCVHGAPAKFGRCLECYPMPQNSLEIQIKALTEMYKELSIQVAGQHEFKLRQCDENKKIIAWEKLTSERICKLEQSKEHHSRNHKDIFERIEKIEKFNKQFKDALSTDIKGYQDILKNYEDRIEELERQISNWEEEFYFIKGKLRDSDKKPHRCPVCSGEGKLYSQYNPANSCNTFITLDALGRMINACHGCDGKGIIWG